jgi:uncharacterized protein YndB with AHSA1/START domain
MAEPFEIRKEIEVAATPEEIWEAIATGAGIDGWFLGTGNAVEPREGGRVRIDFGEGGSGASTVTAWDPPHRFAHRGDAAPDGSLHAFEYVIEARDGGMTVVRLVHSGFLADDWESEYDALDEGDFMYLHQMAQYVTHFRGRRATVISLWRPEEPDREHVLGTFKRELGLGHSVSEGDPVRATLDGLPPVEGVVDFLSPGIIGIRTDDALLRFMHSPQNVAFLGHHIYGDGDRHAIQQAWQSWLDRAFSSAEGDPR